MDLRVTGTGKKMSQEALSVVDILIPPLINRPATVEKAFVLCPTKCYVLEPS